MTEQQLFADYELDNSKWLAIILKFLSGSLFVHLILLLSAVYVPAVRDAFYVALLFSNSADLKTVNRDYELEEIGDVTMVNLANPNRFRYPEGYFNNGEYVEPTTDPTVLALNGDSSLSGSATTMPPLTFDPATTAPTPIPMPTISTPPVTTFPSVNTPPIRRNKNRRSGGGLPPLPNTKEGAKLEPLTAETDENAVPKKPETETKPTPGKESTALLKEEEINKKPLVDFGNKVDQLQKEKKIDLNQPFAVTIEGELEKGGKLSAANVTKNAGDQQLVALTTELVKVLNASGILRTLSDVALKDSPQAKHKIKFDVNNDQTNLTVNIAFELANADVAYKLQSGINLLIAANRQLRKDKVEGQILQNVRAESDGKMIVFKTLMPRQDAQKLIQDQLAAAVKEQQDTTKQ